MLAQLILGLSFAVLVAPFFVLLCGGKGGKPKGKKGSKGSNEAPGDSEPYVEQSEAPMQTEMPAPEPEMQPRTMQNQTTPVSQRPDQVAPLELQGGFGMPGAGFPSQDPWGMNDPMGGAPMMSQMGPGFGGGMTNRGGGRTMMGDATTVHQMPSLALNQGRMPGQTARGGVTGRGMAPGAGGWSQAQGGGFGGGKSRMVGRYPQSTNDGLGQTQMGGRTEQFTRAGDLGQTQMNETMRRAGQSMAPTQAQPGGAPQAPVQKKGKDFQKPQPARQAKAKDPTYETLKDLDEMPEQF